MAQFSDLPLELAWAIFSHMRTVEILELSKLSKYLQHSALTYCLEKSGVRPMVPSSPNLKIPLFGTEVDAALFLRSRETKAQVINRALHMSTFINSVEWLICEFHFPAGLLLQEMRSLRILLQRWTEVAWLTLDFTSVKRYLTFHRAELTRRELGSIADEFQQMLSEVPHKACKAISIHGLHTMLQLLRPLQTPSWRSFKSMMPQSSSIVSKMALKIFGNIRSKRQLPTSQHQTLAGDSLPATIQGSLKADSWIVLVSRILSGPEVRRMYLQHTDLDWSDWSKFLPCINAPSLAHVTFKDLDLPTEIFLDFLERHTKIHILNLENVDTRSDQYDPPGISCPNLSQLHGHWKSIGKFLTHVNDAPKLSSVFMTMEVKHATDLIEAVKTLSPVAAHLGNASLALWLDVRTSQSSWLQVDEDVYPESSGFVDSIHEADSVTLYFGRYGMSSETCRLLVPWVGKFQKLKALVIKENSGFFQDDEARVALESGCRELCPELRKIVC